MELLPRLPVRWDFARWFQAISSRRPPYSGFEASDFRDTICERLPPLCVVSEGKVLGEIHFHRTGAANGGAGESAELSVAACDFDLKCGSQPFSRTSSTMSGVSVRSRRC